MARQVDPRANLIVSSLLAGLICAFMTGVGLWILGQEFLGLLELSRPLAIVGLVVMGTLGLVLTGLYYATGLKNLDYQRREQERAAELEGALRRLQEVEYRLRSIIESSQEVIYIKDLEGRYLLMNPAGGKLMGLPPEAIIGKYDGDLFPEYAQQMREGDRTVMAAGVPQDFEERIRFPNGSDRVFVTTKYPYRTPEGELVGIIGITRDITDRIRYEQQLRVSEAYTRSILEAAPDAVLLVDRQGLIRLANGSAERMFGYDRYALIGMSIEVLMPERFREVHVAHRGHYYAYPHTRPMGSDLDLYALRRDGSEFPTEINLSPLETPDGLLIIASIRDITERKRHLEEIAQRSAELKKIRELNDLKDHFLSTLSHEIKTPLSLIGGYAELLEEKYPDEELLEGVQEGFRRLNEHISSMLDYSALVSGTLPLYKTEVNLEELIRNVYASLEEAICHKRLRFFSEMDPETPCIQADSRRISQLLGALLDNAVKFTPEGGAIGIRVHPEPARVRIEVWDTGPGIPETDRQRIWHAFTQRDLGDALRKGGLGLGLTIAKGLAELHGGHIELGSEPEGGSRFTVFLPIEREPEPKLRISRLETETDQPSFRQDGREGPRNP